MPKFVEPPLPEDEVDAIIKLLKRGARFVASDGSSLDESVQLARLRMAGAVFHYDCLKQPDDPRDYPLPLLPRSVPRRGSFRAQCSHIENQGPYGTCTANGGTSSSEYYRYKAGNRMDLSRMAVYYWARMYDGLLGEDGGATVRSALKAINKIGAPPESLWPYTQDNLEREPPPDVVAAAASSRISSYHAVPAGDVEAIRRALNVGYPVVLALDVFSGFESVEAMRTGKIPMPARGEESSGGHCVYFCGWDDDAERFEGANSWGSSWGDGGFFTVPYQYVENYSWDTWAVVGAV